MSDLKKTDCCQYEYWGDNHSPIRDDGYCMNCGFHPGIQSLQSQLEEAIEVIKGYLGSDNTDAFGCYIDKRAREILAKVKEIEE